MPSPAELVERMDPPFESFSNDRLGAGFPEELDVVSRMWFACGYRPGIGAYLNFFLLEDFIEIHNHALPARFHSFRSMADSFYRTDLFVREVTDSGAKPTGGISSARVRATLAGLMARHRRIAIPLWMMTYFGFSLLENVEKQITGFSDHERQLHLNYMAAAYRIMGIRFCTDRARMETFARRVEELHHGVAENAEKHARHILILGEMIGVRSKLATVGAMLPEATRADFAGIHAAVRPGLARRVGARLLGRVLMKQAIGKPRAAVPVAG